MKIKVNIDGQLVNVDAVSVEVDKMISRSSVAEFKDGTKAELTIMIMDAYRAIEHWDNLGNPIYSLDMQVGVRIKNCPSCLKRK